LARSIRQLLNSAKQLYNLAQEDLDTLRRWHSKKMVDRTCITWMVSGLNECAMLTIVIFRCKSKMQASPNENWSGYLASTAKQVCKRYSSSFAKLQSAAGKDEVEKLLSLLRACDEPAGSHIDKDLGNLLVQREPDAPKFLQQLLYRHSKEGKDAEKKERDREKKDRDREREKKEKDREREKKEKDREREKKEKDREREKKEKDREREKKEKDREREKKEKDRERKKKEKDREREKKEKDREREKKEKDREREKKEKDREREKKKQQEASPAAGTPRTSVSIRSDRSSIRSSASTPGMGEPPSKKARTGRSRSRDKSRGRDRSRGRSRSRDRGRGRSRSRSRSRSGGKGKSVGEKGANGSSEKRRGEKRKSYAGKSRSRSPDASKKGRGSGRGRSTERDRERSGGLLRNGRDGERSTERGRERDRERERDRADGSSRSGRSGSGEGKLSEERKGKGKAATVGKGKETKEGLDTGGLSRRGGAGDVRSMLKRAEEEKHLASEEIETLRRWYNKRIIDMPTLRDTLQPDTSRDVLTVVLARYRRQSELSSLTSRVLVEAMRDLSASHSKSLQALRSAAGEFDMDCFSQLVREGKVPHTEVGQLLAQLGKNKGKDGAGMKAVRANVKMLRGLVETYEEAEAESECVAEVPSEEPEEGEVTD
jgi:hypothetical protein